MKLTHRSYKKELLDEDSIPFADIKQNMKELNFINKYLGGHSITVNGFEQLAGTEKKISVCEIGCGGGDNLVAIYNWCKKKNIRIEITGIDIKKECTDFAKSRKTLPDSVHWITSDYSIVQFTSRPDIIFSSLFCHHFTNEQLVFQINWMMQYSNIGFFINDLQRNFLAYHSIKLLTGLFSASYLVKNDAPLSVARGFKQTELKSLCDAAKAFGVNITWKWAFRFLVIYRHE